MTAAAGEEAVGLGARVSTATQLNGALARVRGGGWPLAAVWLGLGAAFTATTVVSGALGIDPTAITAPGYIVTVLAQALVGGTGAALALRLMISGRPGWLRVDAGLLASAGVIALLTAGFSLAFIVPATLMGRETHPGQILLMAFGLLVGLAAATFAWLRLSLWPAGLLSGRRDVTPATSWRLMRKATRGLLLGYIVLGVPFGVLLAFANPVFVPGADGLTQAGTVAIQFATAAYQIACYGLVATIYELRVARPASLADVFA
jgi:hypothetical protein